MMIVVLMNMINHHCFAVKIFQKGTHLARLPRGEERPGGGRPEAPLLLRAGFEPIPMPERDGDEARRGARAVDIEGRFEVRSCNNGEN